MADIQHLATLTEEDIKFSYITPAIAQAGWEKEQIRTHRSRMVCRARKKGVCLYTRQRQF